MSSMLAAADVLAPIMGLAGVLVGGLISGYVALRSERSRQLFQRDLDRRRDAQEHARERAAARGVARLMSSHFRDAQLTFETARDSGRWWPETLRLGTEIAADDRKLVAGMLAPSAWADVVRAEFALRHMTEWRAMEAGVPPTAELPDAVLDALADSASTLDRARTALAGLAGDPTAPARPATASEPARAAAGDAGNLTIALLRANAAVLAGSAGPPDAEPSDDSAAEGIALCLSGVGYRAMLFHTGALWRLNEAGMLARLDRVSSVGGGSLAAGRLAARWTELGFGPDGVAGGFADEVARPLLDLAGRTLDVPAILSGGLLPGTNANARLERALRRHLLGDKTLQDMPDAPDFRLVASNLDSGTIWRFSRRHLGDWTARLPDPVLPLAQAVAASAAVFPFLSPAILKLDAMGLEYTDGAPRRRRVRLTDGTLFDTLGVETAWKRYRTLLVSDGATGAGLSRGRSQTRAVMSSLADQGRLLRRRQLIDALASGIRQGAYWGMTTDLTSFAERAQGIDVPIASAASLQAIPGRFGRLRDATGFRLVNYGYVLCDAALRTHVDRALAPPVGLPFPEAAI